MRWNLKWLPWRRQHEPSEQTQEAMDRLRQAQRDDARLDAITKRTERIMGTNHLGADIKRALGG